MPNYMQASIMRVDPGKGVLENVRPGVRNSVGFDWNPRTKELWFTNHGRDCWARSRETTRFTGSRARELISAIPSAIRATTARPRLREEPVVLGIRPAGAQARRAHRAPGHEVLHRQDVPAEYRNNIFIAMHGSWNRSTKQGYNVTLRVVNDKGRSSSRRPS